MRKCLTVVFVQMFAFVLLVSWVSTTFAEEVTIQGNVICLIPDYAKGTVNPVIATEPCDGLPPHNHLVVTANKVYTLKGLQDGLTKIESSPNRTNIKIHGKVEGSDQTGWVLFVD